MGPGRSDPVTPIIPRGRMLVWDLETGGACSSSPPETAGSDFWPFSPDGMQVAVAGLADAGGPASPRAIVQLWRVETGEPGPVFAASAWGPGGVAFSPDGGLLSVSWFSGRRREGSLFTRSPAAGSDTELKK